jgi:predicted dehydrogenase/nucleoside-diphosphate-sugar epimerase
MSVEMPSAMVLDGQSKPETAPSREVAASRSPDRLRVGLIGSGRMGLHHLKAISACGQAIVVGIADPAADAEELRALVGGDAIIVPEAGELLTRARPDVVHIVTPPATHAALAAQAIRAGAHVYLEKPFTATAAEAVELLDLADRHGVKVCPGHQVLFERPARQALASLAAIGRLVHIESYFSFKMVRRTIAPAEQVKDVLPHAVYPVVEQLRAGSGLADDPIEIAGVSARPEGEAVALLRLGTATATILVTLNGRPIESYQNIVGTNGSFRVDYVSGCLISLIGPGTGPGVLFTPYRRAWQTVMGATRGFWRLLFGKAGSYQGLHALVEEFYSRLRSGAPAPFTHRSILDTVEICERIGASVDEAARHSEEVARVALAGAQAALPPLQPGRAPVLLTGGTGLLGRRVALELRHAGFPVRAVARRVPPCSRRVPGVEYVAADLSTALRPAIMEGVGVVVHCAAETTGGRRDHQRNSVDATRRVIESARNAGVRRVVHVSSLAVLKPSREVGHPVDESTPLDSGHFRRGPYVWGKAESEVVAQGTGHELGVAVKVIRPGPLVDYAGFSPPGRLGRELGPWFVGIGPRRGTLSVCDISTAARVIRSYLEDFDAAPSVLNLVESPAPTRNELLARLRAGRPDLHVIWLPAWVLRVLSGVVRLVQRAAFRSREPIDIAAAFASERYRTDLAASVIQRAGPTAVTQANAYP